MHFFTYLLSLRLLSQVLCSRIVPGQEVSDQLLQDIEDIFPVLVFLYPVSCIKKLKSTRKKIFLRIPLLKSYLASLVEMAHVQNIFLYI